MKDVTCTSSHPEDLDDGRTLGPGDTGSVDEKHPHNALLIKEGRLTVNKPRRSAAQAENKENAE